MDPGYDDEKRQQQQQKTKKQPGFGVRATRDFQP